MSRINDALREARKAANLTQYDLAEILGVGQGFVSDVERGRREFPEGQYDRLPESIRLAVLEAAIAVLLDRISELRKRIEGT